MPILNYTTKVSQHQTLLDISRILGRAGAKSITHQYVGGRVGAISFVLTVKRIDVQFLLPTNPYNVLQSMKRDKARNAIYEQAERCAWRIVKDWIEAQMALVESGQAEAAQVFLPYAQQADGRTAYEMFLENHQKALPSETMQ